MKVSSWNCPCTVVHSRECFAEREEYGWNASIMCIAAELWSSAWKLKSEAYPGIEFRRSLWMTPTQRNNNCSEHNSRKRKLDSSIRSYFILPKWLVSYFWWENGAQPLHLIVSNFNSFNSVSIQVRIEVVIVVDSSSRLLASCPNSHSHSLSLRCYLFMYLVVFLYIYNQSIQSHIQFISLKEKLI